MFNLVILEESKQVWKKISKEIIKNKVLIFQKIFMSHVFGSMTPD